MERWLAERSYSPDGEYGTNEHDTIGRMQGYQDWHVYHYTQGRVGGGHVGVCGVCGRAYEGYLATAMNMFTSWDIHYTELGGVSTSQCILVKMGC